MAVSLKPFWDEHVEPEVFARCRVENGKTDAVNRLVAQGKDYEMERAGVAGELWLLFGYGPATYETVSWSRRDRPGIRHRNQRREDRCEVFASSKVSLPDRHRDEPHC